MGCEVWVLKGTKLITNTKKQRLKILSRGEIAKNTVLKKKERKKAKNRKKQNNQTNKQTKIKVTEITKYVYMNFVLKIGSFFFQKYRSMEQNGEPRDKSTNLWSLYLQQSRQGYTMEKRQPL